MDTPEYHKLGSTYDAERKASQHRVNPHFCLRNYLMERAIEVAEN